MIRCGIFGKSLCGKSTLAKKLSLLYFQKRGIRSLVLDTVARAKDWGAHCWVCHDPVLFWQMVWKCRSCLVIVDDGSVTIARDKELIGVFTTMRHCHHRLIVIGHDASDLLPKMRRQFDELYLFRQSEEAVESWYSDVMDKEIFKAAQLNQYEFLRCRQWKPIERLHLTLN